MSDHLKKDSHEEGYQLNYIVNITDCQNCTINIHQTGKPTEPPIDPVVPEEKPE